MYRRNGANIVFSAVSLAWLDLFLSLHIRVYGNRNGRIRAKNGSRGHISTRIYKLSVALRVASRMEFRTLDACIRVRHLLETAKKTAAERVHY